MLLIGAIVLVVGTTIAFITVTFIDSSYGTQASQGAEAMASGGGTDANIMYGHDIGAPILATGMREVHTTHEYLDLKDFFGCARLTMRVLAGLSAAA